MGEGSAVIPISETSQESSEVKGMAAQQTNELVEKGLDPGEGRPAQLVLCVCGGRGDCALVTQCYPCLFPSLGLIPDWKALLWGVGVHTRPWQRPLRVLFPWDLSGSRCWGKPSPSQEGSPLSPQASAALSSVDLITDSHLISKA